MIRVAICLFLSLALPVSGFVPERSVEYTCRMTGDRHSACCCNPGGGSSEETSVERCGCCDVGVRSVESPDTRPATDSTHKVAPPAPVALAPRAAGPLFLPPGPLAREAGPPPGRAPTPALYLLHLSLLH